jgi:lipoprotein-anchoring transpeptidase ErfK/SrfK
VTDLIASPDAETAPSAAATEQVPSNNGNPPLEWAPHEPAPKKHRTALWVGLGAGALLVALGAASMVLIAPGTTIAGVQVGGLTPGAAAEAVNTHLAELEVTVESGQGASVTTGAELGATIDATTLANDAFADHPMWNLGSWMPSTIPGEISLDHVLATDSLRSIVPGSYEDAVNAGVVFDTATAAYATTPAESGTGIDLDALTASITSTMADGRTALVLDATPSEVPALVTDDDAAEVAAELNAMLTTVGFYVGEERTVPIDPAVAATWISVTDEDGKLAVSADASAIQASVDTLPALVDRAPVNAEVVVNNGGDVLQEISAGVNGRAVGELGNVASDFAAQLQEGQAAYALEVTETPFETASIHRYIDLNLSDQRTYLYENGTLVNSYAISSGLDSTPTPTGNFTVFAHTRLQNMGCYEGADYCTKDVPYSTWFAPDIAFHGTYWHNNFGQQMSHGCVNMPIDIARYVYEWAPVGTEVSVHW